MGGPPPEAQSSLITCTSGQRPPCGTNFPRALLPYPHESCQTVAHLPHALAGDFDLWSSEMACGIHRAEAVLVSVLGTLWPEQVTVHVGHTVQLQCLTTLAQQAHVVRSIFQHGTLR